MNIRIFYLLIFTFYHNVCEASDLCDFQTCGECISNANCEWCAADTIAKDTPRCSTIGSASKTTTSRCPKHFTKKSELRNDIIQDVPFSGKIANVAVQFRPQHIIMKARPKVNLPITMYYKPAQDFPIDVYYLMDISFTMSREKDALLRQAKEIYHQLTAYTNNVRLGIGSFVEKPGYPYVDQYKIPRQKSHAFKNELSLTNDTSAFITTLSQITFGENYDDPEAGLDALMQAMTCDKEVGWRPGARRIIVLCTDSTYHSAGDGKALGVIRPNDMKCHIDANKEYNATMALTYDYPSVSQINKVAKDGNFIVIFAAKQVVSQDYTNLAKHILGAKYANLGNEQDAVEIIKTAYRESTTIVNLSYDFPPFIQLTLDQNCHTKPMRNCESTVEQRTVTIKGNLTINYCPPSSEQMEQNLVINVVGINDKLTIKLDIDCICDCEKVPGVKSAKCHNAGVEQCGICKCDPGSYGVDCRCNGTSTDVTKDNAKCKLEGDKNLCSGRGTCICGKCEKCAKGFSGDVCQYDDSSCPYQCHNNGKCSLGYCHCNAGWTGSDCGCILDTTACVAPYSKKLCSGNGECVCGTCICNKLVGNNGSYFSGKYCDDCDDCAEKRCKELEDYVVCNVMKDKLQCDKQYNTTNTMVEFVNKTELNGQKWYIGKWCKTRLENDSYIIFKYQYADDNLRLGIQNEAELPPKANIFIAVGSAIGIVLLIGIVTLIVWKILVDLHDKREYEKFSKESNAQGFDVSMNPLYDPPQVSFQNPAFQQ